MNSQTILILILAIISFDFVFEQVLDFLNSKNQKSKLPSELEDVYDQEKFAKAQEYQRANSRFEFFTSTWGFLLMITIILSGGFGWLDGILKENISNPIFVSLAFFGILFIASDIINTPFSIYKTFVIEERFGFNKTSINTFILDKIKGYFIAAIMGGIIIGIFLLLINKLGSDFWIWFWLVISAFLIFINMFYTSLIVPLFNKLKPLEEGELRRAIEEYSKKVDFSLTNIYVIDGSKRSAKANAYFSGIGAKKKIVLFDTLIQNHTKEELVAVLAHEVGHFKKKHIILGLVLSLLQVRFMLYVLSLFVNNPNLSIALGAKESTIHLNLIAFGILFTPISHITGLFMNIISRKNEYEADRYAAETYKGQYLQDALKKLSADNLSNLTPHPAYVFFHYSHPPLLERLRALKKI